MMKNVIRTRIAIGRAKHTSMCKCLFCTNSENPCVKLYNVLYEPIQYEPNRTEQTAVLKEFRAWLQSHPKHMWTDEEHRILRESRRLLLDQLEYGSPSPESQIQPFLQLFGIKQ